MSAPVGTAHEAVSRDESLLAPLFRAQVDAAIVECGRRGLDAFVFEAHRSDALAAEYYAKGRTVIPPTRTVTNAPNARYTWHGYGLAVDVISRAHLWSVPESWFRAVADVFKAHGCKWGGDWRMKDLPHFQWGKCKPSPSDLARSLYASGGVVAVWKAVGAI